jgi:hypothetical protein
MEFDGDHDIRPAPATSNVLDDDLMGNVLVPSTSDVDAPSGSYKSSHVPPASLEEDVDYALLTDEELLALGDRGLTAIVRQGIRMAVDDPAAMEKSPEQLVAMKEVVKGEGDLSVILCTGGGKSLLWQFIPKIRPKWGCIIIIPYVQVLEEQLKSSQDKGIIAAHYTADSVPPDGFQNLFIQPETARSRSFKM